MDRRREVLAALRVSGGSAVSGETLATSLGVSRAAVGKHVAALREVGYVIEAAPGEGYRLIATPDAPVPEEVEELTTAPLWVRFSGGGPTESTNDDARALARSGAPEGTVVLASEQATGRGRLGRTWASPAGGAYLSMILRPNVAVPDVPPLALVTALGVAHGLEALGARPSLKWPNDVLLAAGKVAGILLEMSAEADRVEWVVIGCGLNVRRPRDRSFEGAAYIEDEVTEATPAMVAAAVLDGVAGAYERFSAGTFAVLLDDYQARHALTDRDARVSDIEGRELASGRVSGVDEWGRLVVETSDGPVALAAGEVTLG